MKDIHKRIHDDLDRGTNMLKAVMWAGKVSLALTVLALICVLWVKDCGEGIVQVPGYEHGVAMCQGERDESFEMMDQEDEFHMWQDKGITYVVNWGHMTDSEVTRLVELAEVECVQFYTK